MSGLTGVVGSNCISSKKTRVGLLRHRKLTAKEKLLLAQGGTHTSVLDVLTKKLRAKLEELIPVENERYDRAFRLFTPTDVITPQCFHALLTKFRMSANRHQSYALFHKYDVDCRGTLDRNKFLNGVFPGRRKSQPPAQQQQPQQFDDAPTPPKRVGGIAARPKPQHIAVTNSVAMSDVGIMLQKPPPRHRHTAATDRLAHKPMLTHHHPAREQHETPLGDNIPFEEVIKRIRDKIDQRTSKASDRFRQAFKIFAKASGITPDEFHEGLLQLGFRLSNEQNKQLFDTFDVNKSGDLDLNEFVQGISLDDSSIKYINAHVERQKREEARRKRYQMAVQSVERAWTIEDMERKLREKIEQHTSKSSDCFRQAFKIFKKSCGIRRQEFHDALAELGLDLNREHTDKLFAKYDIDGSGDIDLPEFVRGVLPADYTGGTWVAEADEMHRIEAERKKLQPDSHLNRVEITDWSLDNIQFKVREKITQKTTRSSDTFRQVYKIFQKSSGITLAEFRQGLLILGFRLNDAQANGLFNRYDTDRSGTIDLSEFCRHVLPPDYNGDGDHWGHTPEEHKQRAKDAITYVELTKNGTVPVPTPPNPMRGTATPTRPSSAPQTRPHSASSSHQPPNRQRHSTRPSDDANIWDGDATSPEKLHTRPASARPASARPSSARSHQSQQSGNNHPQPRPTSARSCSSSSSVSYHENPFKSKRRHFFHHHSLWQRKVKFHREQMQQQQQQPNDPPGDSNAGGTSDDRAAKPNDPHELDEYEDIVDDGDDDDAFDKESYKELRTPSKPRPASARPSSAKVAKPPTARPPSARVSRPQTAASTASSTGSRTSQSPRVRRQQGDGSDTSSQCSSQVHQITSASDGVHPAKFKPRLYGPGFKKMFLQLAKERLDQER
ncbi:hypothetical protein H310_02145 [Aphanomyces invadans]|uniref:EF-hand domain-containing protein n=1 Tax=Aphanomyces invadans TaxID=157072 RepID=A0A024UPX0_9STRA|nr:hypothetical protein H310_02145 [Aphanomyces invadans]ETW07688.1 hypothetical protein H310_02145 [Aphanomyces invadans]|eukprot:XP_008863781.1 hypothetical protein H310_02145 [Aphanomyces invadans]